MAKKRGKRIYRKATDEERKRHTKIRGEIADELPDIKRRARQRLAILKTEGRILPHRMRRSTSSCVAGRRNQSQRIATIQVGT